MPLPASSTRKLTSAFCTFKRHETCMGIHMTFQTDFVIEALITQSAYEGAFLGVDSDVRLYIWALVRCIGTEVTQKKFWHSSFFSLYGITWYLKKERKLEILNENIMKFFLHKVNLKISREIGVTRLLGSVLEKIIIEISEH